MRQLRANFDALVEHLEVMAQLQHAKYASLLKSGFTETQALELCRNVF